MIRWGILGGGNIARRFAQSMEDIRGSRITAVSCRSREKAEDFSQVQFFCRHQASLYGMFQTAVNPDFHPWKQSLPYRK